jgi:hypothetical protein
MIFEVPTFEWNFNGRDCVFTRDSVSTRRWSLGDFRQFLSLPALNVIIDIISTNASNENGTHPGFVPVDVTRITPLDSDPYERYRTHTYVLKA